MNIREQMDEIYGGRPLDSVPWNMVLPPALLVEIVDSGWVEPCSAVDLGCGAGNYAVWLASRGFDVTGIDISSRAVDLAKRLAEAREVSCAFEIADLTGDDDPGRARFDFAFDWEVLHHVFPEDRPRYLKNVHQLLRPKGKYLSLSFSEKDESFNGSGKYRETLLGTRLYFSSEDELKELFESLFKIHELKTVEVEGKRGTHIAVMGLLERIAEVEQD